MKLSHPIFKTFCLTICLLAATYLNGQSAQLKTNKQISYLNTFINDYSFDPLNIAANDAQFLKLNLKSQEPEILYLHNWLVTEIFDNAELGAYALYKDSELSKAMSKDGLLKKIIQRDTIITFDIETYEEKLSIVDVRLNPNRLVGLKCKQVLYFNEKDKQFYTQLLAIAPLCKEVEGDKVEELFWVKMDSSTPSKMGVDSKTVSCAVLTSGVNADVPDLLQENEDSKGNQEVFKERFYEQIKRTDAKIEEGYYGSEDFLKSEDPLLVVDTLVTYDPNTYEQTLKPIANRIEPDYFNLVQEWYYDAKSKQLYSRLKAIAPVKVVTDKNGKFLYSDRLFYFHTNN